MKKLVLAVVTSALLIATPVMAEKTKEPATSMKIGVFDIHEVLKESAEVKAHQEAMQKEFGPRLEEIKAMDQGLRESIEKLQRDRDVMSESERTKLEKEVQALQQELMQMQAKYQQESQAKQQTLMQEYLNKVKAEVEKYAQEEAYDMIMLSEAVPYMKDQYEVTKAIIKRLN